MHAAGLAMVHAEGQRHGRHERDGAQHGGARRGGAETRNVCLRSARVMKDVILDPAKGEKSGNELVAEMRQCDPAPVVF